jgi:N utilization substance protein B
MGKTRSELREKAMVILYQLDILKNNSIDYNVENIISENLDIDSEFVRNIVYGVVTHLEELDEMANKYMNKWTIDRIDKTGAAILRIGLYEIMFEDTPNIVAINEAVELAKKYSDDNVRKIINAVLDKVNIEN